MTRKRKSPLTGAEPDDAVGQAHGGSPDIEMMTDGEVTGMSAEEREITALLRMTGWKVDDSDDVTEEEADLIVLAAESEPISAEELARVREGVLRRRFGASAIAGSELLAGSDEQEEALTADQSSASRPSLIKQWKAQGRRLDDLAQSLRLDAQTLLTLDRGGAATVPTQLVQVAAAALKLSPRDAALCFTSARGDVLAMAAHRHRNAPRTSGSTPREFLDIIEASRLPEHDKRYWREVVASEISHDGSPEAGSTST